MTLASALAAGRYQIHFPRPAGPRFDSFVSAQAPSRIQAQRPEVLLLGNSILMTGVDAAGLSANLGVPVYSFGINGSASAVWYAALKNNIIALPGQKPRFVVILFRDSTITLPDYRVDGPYLRQLDEYATPRDALIIQRAFVNQMNPLEKAADSFLPVYAAGPDLRRDLETELRHAAPRILLDCDAACSDKAVQTVLDNANLNDLQEIESAENAEAILYSPAALDFAARVDQSFLPPIIELCRENNIQLILVRAKTQKYSEREPALLSRYVRDLAAYLAQNDVIFVDFSHDSRLQASMFVDNVHFNQRGRIAFTQFLAGAVLPYLR